MTVKILLVDDHKIVREGLKSLIEKDPNLRVVGEAENGRKTIALLDKLLPDVVVMDITMPDLNGIDATRHIVTKSPNIKVLALSIHSDQQFISKILEAGARGYLLKDCAFEELIAAIATVSKNQTYLSSKIASVVVKDYITKLSGDKANANFSILTTRERETLQLLSEGKSTKEIAGILNVSVKTVETYRQHLMEKLNLHSVAELTKYAIREGLTTT